MVRPREFQEGGFVPEMVLSFQPDFRGKWMPNYEGPCAVTPITMDGDEFTRPENIVAVKKYFVKK